MSKKAINQNTNYDSEFLSSTGSDFIFDEKPINRLKNTDNDFKKDLSIQKLEKVKELEGLKEQINSKMRLCTKPVGLTLAQGLIV